MKKILLLVLCLAPAARAGDITADGGIGLSSLNWKNSPAAIAGDTGVASLSLRGDIRTLRWNLGLELAYGGFDYGVGQMLGSFDIFLNKEGPIAFYLGASLASLHEFNDHGDSGSSFAGGGQAGVLFNRTGIVLVALEALRAGAWHGRGQVCYARSSEGKGESSERNGSHRPYGPYRILFRGLKFLWSSRSGSPPTCSGTRRAADQLSRLVPGEGALLHRARGSSHALGTAALRAAPGASGRARRYRRGARPGAAGRRRAPAPLDIC